MNEPTIILVHGAFADASSWRPVSDELRNAGLAVRAVPNPLRGPVNDAAYLTNLLSTFEGPLLLVGHSYGGAVITAVGDAKNVAGLVYIAAFAPDQGEDLGSLQAPYDDPPATAQLQPSPLPDGGAEVSIAPESFAEVFAADLPAEQAAFMTIAQRPLSVTAFSEPSPAAGWHTKPSWAVLPTADKAINPEVHRFSYERAGARVTEAAGASHAVMLSQPHLVADVIKAAAMQLTTVASAR